MSLTAIFLASLLGSPHCAGMCGGFVAFYSGQTTGLGSHLVYSLGRLFTYLSLGLVAALVGQSVNAVGLGVGVQQLSALVIGCLMVYWGIKGIIVGNLAQPAGKFAHFVSRLLGSRLANLARSNESILKPALVGTLSTLLPCGWLYVYLALAGASASFLEAPLIMTAFWLGTIPVMLSLGSIFGVLTERLRSYLPVLTSILLILAGLFALSGHMGLLSMEHHHHH